MNSPDDIVGPATIPCESQCGVPEGVTLVPVPIPRHGWSDVLVCPNGCGRAFLIVRESDE